MNTNKFYILVADWCPYCRAAKAAIFDLVEKYYSNNNIVLIEDTSDEYKSTSAKLEADMIPAFIIADEDGNKVNAYEDNDRSFEALLGFYAENTGTKVLEEDQPIYSK